MYPTNENTAPTSEADIGPVTARDCLSESLMSFRFPNKNRPAFQSLFAKNLHLAGSDERYESYNTTNGLYTIGTSIEFHNSMGASGRGGQKLMAEQTPHSV